MPYTDEELLAISGKAVSVDALDVLFADLTPFLPKGMGTMAYSGKMKVQCELSLDVLANNVIGNGEEMIVLHNGTSAYESVGPFMKYNGKLFANGNNNANDLINGKYVVLSRFSTKLIPNDGSEYASKYISIPISVLPFGQRATGGVVIAGRPNVYPPVLKQSEFIETRIATKRETHSPFMMLKFIDAENGDDAVTEGTWQSIGDGMWIINNSDIDLTFGSDGDFSFRSYINQEIFIFKILR